MKSSMDWIVWEMLEKLKADKDILTRMRDEAKAICLDMTSVDKIFLKNFQNLVDIGQKTKYYLSNKTNKK